MLIIHQDQLSKRHVIATDISKIAIFFKLLKQKIQLFSLYFYNSIEPFVWLWWTIEFFCYEMRSKETTFVETALFAMMLRSPIQLLIAKNVALLC